MRRLLLLLCLSAGDETCQLQITSNWWAELAFTLVPRDFRQSFPATQVKDLAKKLFADEGPSVELLLDLKMPPFKLFRSCRMHLYVISSWVRTSLQNQMPYNEVLARELWLLSTAAY